MHIAGVWIVSIQTSLLDVVGGASIVGVSAGAMDLVRLVRRGLPVRKTLANRRKLGTLTPEQSDRLVRVARLLATAEETFGNQDKAGIWLRRPTTVFGGERPLDLLDTDEGAREVETLLGRISHGIAA